MKNPSDQLCLIEAMMRVTFLLIGGWRLRIRTQKSPDYGQYNPIYFDGIRISMLYESSSFEVIISNNSVVLHRIFRSRVGIASLPHVLVNAARGAERTNDTIGIFGIHDLNGKFRYNPGIGALHATV